MMVVVWTVMIYIEEEWNLCWSRFCHMQVYLFGNYIPTVISSPNHISLPSTMATFLTICLIAVLQPSGYSIFHSGDTPIQLSLP